MKNMIVCMFLLSSGLTFGATAGKYVACEHKGKVRSPKNATGYYWDRECKQIYVLPAKENLIRIDSMAFEVTDSECSSVLTLAKAHEDQIKAIRNQMKLPVQSERQIKRIYAEVAKHNRTKDRLDRSRFQLLKQKGEVRSNLIRVEGAIAQFNNELERCKKQGRYCGGIESRITRMEGNKFKLETAKSQLNIQLETIKEQNDELDRQILGLENRAQALVPDEVDNLGKISNLVKKLGTELAPYRDINGGVIKVILENLHYDVTRDYERMNPNIKAVPIPVTSAVQFQTSGMGGLIDESVGREFISMPGVQYSDRQVADGMMSIVFGNSLSANIKLSAISACMLKEAKNTRNEQLAKFNVNMFYQYDLTVKNHYDLKYNYGMIFKKIKSTHSKGGFFKTSSMSKLLQETKSTGALTMEFLSEDPRDNYSEEDKNQLKAEFLERALFNIGVAKGYVQFDSSRTLSLPQARRSGAQIGSDMLRDKKNCKKKWCQYAALALDMGHALFGRNDVSSQFIESQNHLETESKHEVSAITETGSATFVKRISQ